MGIRYKINIIAALKVAGYSTYRIRKEKIISQQTLQNIREGKPIELESISTICKMLNCQPGDLIEVVSAEDSVKK